MIFSDEIKNVAGKFRSGQERISSVPSSSIPNGKKKKQEKVSPQRQVFLNKYRGGRFEEFNAVDLVYYFSEVSKSSEKFKTYAILNFRRDAAIMKSLLEYYPPQEIAGMIDFVFSRVNPKIENPTINMLRSSYGRKIYEDYFAWVGGVYSSDKKVAKRKKVLKKREYTRRSSKAKAVIGWDELESEGLA